MVGKSQRPRELANQVLNSRFLPLGERKVQELGGACYVAFPQPHAREFGVEAGATVETHIHAGTGALVVLPPGVDVEDVTDSEASA